MNSEQDWGRVYIKTSLWSLGSPTSGVKHEKIWGIEIFGLKLEEGPNLTQEEVHNNIPHMKYFVTVSNIWGNILSWDRNVDESNKNVENT